MPALLPRAQHAFRAACEPAALATRSLAGTAIAIPLARGSLATTAQAQPRSYPNLQPSRHSSSSSSQRWKTRQTSDPYTKSSKLSTLKSRAAYKLLEINDKHKLFKPGQSVVDLGYAPGSWSQVAKNRVGESGRVVGIDVIPAQPPRGVSALQGNFLSEAVQERMREFVREWKEGAAQEEGREEESVLEAARVEKVDSPLAEEEEAPAAVEEAVVEKKASKKQAKKLSAKALDLQEGRVVDVVLSDMCAPFPGLELSSWIRSVNRPYRRMMNTSGNPFRDHAGSIDLCMAALTFCHDCLVTGGHFLCKFYQGPEDKDLENRMKRMFEKVYRIKPDSSRKESRESYFVGLRRKADVSKEEALG